MSEQSINSLDDLWREMLPDETMRQVAEEQVKILTLSNGKMADGRDFYAYFSVTPLNYIALCKAQQEATPRGLGEFGEILHWGYGTEPSEAVREEMTEKYGASANFVKDIEEAIALARKNATTPE